MLVIGGRNQQPGAPGATSSPPTPSAPYPSVDETGHDSAVPVPAAGPVSDDPVQTEVDRALGDYQRRLVEDTVVGTFGGVDVRMALTGDIVGVDIAEHVPIRYDVQSMGGLIVRASEVATAAAAERRARLADEITFFKERAMDRVRHFQAGPDAAMQEMGAVRYW